MLYGINNNNDNNILLGSQLLGQEAVNGVTNPILEEKENPYSAGSPYLVDESAISKTAYALYQREVDIKNFTKDVMNMEDDTERMTALFNKGVLDPFEVLNIDKLLDNEELLKDLEVNF